MSQCHIDMSYHHRIIDHESFMVWDWDMKSSMYYRPSSSLNHWWYISRSALWYWLSHLILKDEQWRSWLWGKAQVVKSMNWTTQDSICHCWIITLKIIILNNHNWQLLVRKRLPQKFAQRTRKSLQYSDAWLIQTTTDHISYQTESNIHHTYIISYISYII